MDRVRAKSKTAFNKRTAIIASAVLAVVVIIATLFSVDFRSRRIDRDRVSIETVRQGMMEIKVSANGELQSDNIEELASQVSGRVAKLHVKPGAQVEIGRLLVELTNPQLIASAEEAESAWEGSVKELQAARAQLQTGMLNQEGIQVQAKFALEKARLQLEAESRLIGQKIISDIDYKRTQLNVSQAEKLYQIESNRLREIRDNINVQLAVSEARVSQLAGALERARDQVANLRIVAGISGIVQAMDIEVGQQLQPGSPVGRVAQQDDLYAELKVPAREATNVRLGQNVLVDTRSGTVDGVVSRIDPGVTNGVVLVDVELRGKLPAGSRPQLQVEGTIYIDKLPNTLYVGKPAFVKSDAVITVYKLDSAGKYAERASIRVGKVSVNQVQVLEGLKAGDRIITSEISEWQDQERILLN
ncbi:MAG: HlyD family efflux transporter periplasmic adaptor subunit [Lysobacteraceae bacterium]|nr:MAG: HlyD family efflux transporter periplasmic adaptor subunit [Xanthomonadaceae bacterium]